MSLFIRNFVLAVRLFANMVGGHAALRMILLFIQIAGKAAAPDYVFWPVTVGQRRARDGDERARTVRGAVAGVRLYHADRDLHRSGGEPGTLNQTPTRRPAVRRLIHPECDMSSKLIRVLAVVAVLFVVASPALAQGPTLTAEQAELQQSRCRSNPRTGPGLGIGLSVVGIGIGLGLIGFAALSGVARQPEQAGTIRGLMILLAALVEGAGIIGIVFSFAIIILG